MWPFLHPSHCELAVTIERIMHSNKHIHYKSVICLAVKSIVIIAVLESYLTLSDQSDLRIEQCCDINYININTQVMIENHAR